MPTEAAAGLRIPAWAGSGHSSLDLGAALRILKDLAVFCLFFRSLGLYSLDNMTIEDKGSIFRKGSEVRQEKAQEQTSSCRLCLLSAVFTVRRRYHVDCGLHAGMGAATTPVEG